MVLDSIGWTDSDQKLSVLSSGPGTAELWWHTGAVDADGDVVVLVLVLGVVGACAAGAAAAAAAAANTANAASLMHKI